MYTENALNSFALEKNRMKIVENWKKYNGR